ncbi:MAG: sugar transporter [Actinobacteria bacterium HGW-Actinobacteria-5]|jgi:melibiose permease/lactose/raffinose/galactose permease|nr:MAG: sugar transporter [Actinobacteria bacterium HGW-Actinobacteria-5]
MTAEPNTVPTVPPGIDRRNLWTFGVGTVGRDMVYTLVAVYLVFFLSDILQVPRDEFVVLGWLILAARLFDAVADIVMGGIVDNTRTRWGQYKPWIAGGVVASAVFTVLLFSDLGLSGPMVVIVFAVVYLCWSLSWTANDIPYWSLMPALTLDQKQRERFGSVAKIFATLGLFTVVVAVLPVTKALAPSVGSVTAWTVFAAGVVTIMLIGQAVTLIGVREPKLVVEQERTRLRELAHVVFRNDQLLWTAVAMVLFMTGYLTTTTFGTYYFKYVYGDEGMYSPFGAVLVGSQLLGYAIFPAVSKRISRRRLYTIATGLILVGYLVFFLSPANIVLIAIAGLLLFIGDSFITLLMLVFLTDTIEYGQWKLGRRNQAVTFALQPFINKVGAALSTQVVTIAVWFAALDADHPELASPSALFIIRIGMLVVPPVLIVVSYLIYRAKYRIDDAFYARIVSDLRDRGQLR